MTKKGPVNLPASIHHRLLNLSVSRSEDPNLTLTRFALERLLYRLAQSQFSNQFILKGAMLFSLWAESPHRPTRDLDLLGFGEPSIDGLAAIYQNLCKLTVGPDGLTFDSDSVHVSEIREGQTYLGRRVKLVTRLGAAGIIRFV